MEIVKLIANCPHFALVFSVATCMTNCQIGLYGKQHIPQVKGPGISDATKQPDPAKLWARQLDMYPTVKKLQKDKPWWSLFLFLVTSTGRGRRSSRGPSSHLSSHQEHTHHIAGSSTAYLLIEKRAKDLCKTTCKSFLLSLQCLCRCYYYLSFFLLANK